MTAVATETELKLRFSPSCLHEVLSSPVLTSPRGTRTQQLVAAYFDTPALHLWRNRLALRVRREGGRWLQAVKGGGTVESGVHARLEIETVIGSDRPDVSVLPLHPLTKILRSRKIAAALVPVLHTEITRTLRLLEPVPGVLIEAAIDRGVIRSGRRRERICELELELKGGPVSALFDLAHRLAEQVPLALEHRSKAERGYALFNPQIAIPAKASLVRLTRKMNTGDAFHAIAAAGLAQIHANERGVIESDNPEYLHQMRVGIRRLRSALSLFREPLGESAMRHAATLRAISADLAAARNWDMLVSETLPAMAAVSTRPSLAPAFLKVCDQRRATARRSAKLSIKTNSYNSCLLQLGGWLAGLPPATSAGWYEPARIHAARTLAAAHARVIKRGRRLEQCTDAELHQLRIAVKKLRYAVEFFAGLFQINKMTVQRTWLAKLQDILGVINDAAAVEPLLAATMVAMSDQDVGAAVRSVRGWHQARAAARRMKLQRVWRGFCAARQPWGR